MLCIPLLASRISDAIPTPITSYSYQKSHPEGVSGRSHSIAGNGLLFDVTSVEYCLLIDTFSAESILEPNKQT